MRNRNLVGFQSAFTKFVLFSDDLSSEERSTTKAPETTKTKSAVSSGGTGNSQESTSTPERVLIIVEVAGGDSEARGFRIKREHTVYNILKGASKNFHIDPMKYVLSAKPIVYMLTAYYYLIKGLFEDGSRRR